MVRTNEEAVAAALATRTNVPATCQKVTRGYYAAPSAGDRDRDGDADAVDGWASEPTAAREPGNRTPRLGSPVSWAGGSSGNGHRAIIVVEATATSEAQIRSTDAPASGITSTVPLSWVEREWGLHYLGASKTIDGEPIPFVDHSPEGPKVTKAPRKNKVARAHRLLERAAIRAEARGQKARAKALRAALKATPEF